MQQYSYHTALSSRCSHKRNPIFSWGF